jgi:hypothetical protein
MEAAEAALFNQEVKKMKVKEFKFSMITARLSFGKSLTKLSKPFPELLEIFEAKS